MYNGVHPRRVATGLALLGASALIASGCSAGTSTLTTPGSTAAAAPQCTSTVPLSDVKIYVGVGTLSSDYWQDVIAGAKAVAKSAGLEDNLEVVSSDFDGQKLVNTIQSKLAAGGAGAVIVADPASTAFTQPLVNVAEKAGARLVTMWNRPADLHPWDTGDGCWVANQTFKGVPTCQYGGEQLIDAMGGTGGVFAILGVPDDPTSKERFQGLQAALSENPNAKLLDTQVGNWDQTTAQQLVTTAIGQYGDQLQGVWAANDAMSLGAVEALRAAGLVGKVKVASGGDGSHAGLQAIQAGDMVASEKTPGFAQGAADVALGIAAAVGDVDVSTLTQAQRDFYLKEEPINGDNVDAALQEVPDAQKYTYDSLKQNFWVDGDGQIVDSQ